MRQNYKYYAVAKGNKIGIFDDVREFYHAIKDYPLPLFKADNNRQKIVVWFEKNKIILPDQKAKPFIKKRKRKINRFDIDREGWFANISSTLKNNDLSWSLMIFSGNKKMHEDKGIVAHHSGDLIVGHMEAILHAVKYANKHNKKITIFFTYDALKDLAEGKFSINLPQARTFQDVISDYDNYELIKIEKTTHPNYLKAVELSEIALLEHQTLMLEEDF